MPKKIQAGLAVKPGLHLLINSSVPVLFAGKFEGLTFQLLNSSQNPVTFVACDSRLDIVMQAQNSEGNWQDIEYLPGSGCGNSYHTLELPSGHMWEFAVPKYSGPVKSRLRVALTRANQATIYSESFEGSIHPKQFTVEEGNTATSIIDPHTK